MNIALVEKHVRGFRRDAEVRRVRPNPSDANLGGLLDHIAEFARQLKVALARHLGCFDEKEAARSRRSPSKTRNDSGDGCPFRNFVVKAIRLEG